MPRMTMARLIHASLALLVLCLSLAACGDQMREAKISAELRGQLESTLRAMEMRRTVPGLQHRQIAVEPDRDDGGYLVKIYEVKIGAAAIGFQSFSLVTFNLSSNGNRFAADGFKFKPKPVSEAPETAPGMLIAQLKAWAPTIQLPE